jgi:phosphoribosylformimino-5-aminoimidazole carboxamide ribotide isomerase
MTIIPAIDIIDGKCVRLTKGNYEQKKIYNDNPAEVAKQFEAVGVTRLHLVDLDGAKAGKVVNLSVLEKIASTTKLHIDFGGGVKAINDVEDIFNAGALMVTIGSLAVKQTNVVKEWILKYGAHKFFIGADVLDEKIKISGWLEDTGINIFDFIANWVNIGAVNIFCTDISKDGVLQGPSIDLYKKIIASQPHIQLVASGGVSNVEDVKHLKQIGCGGVIIGKAIYEGRITMDQLVNYNQ